MEEGGLGYGGMEERRLKWESEQPGSVRVLLSHQATSEPAGGEAVGRGQEQPFLRVQREDLRLVFHRT